MAKNDCDVEVNARIDDAIPNLNDFDDFGSDINVTELSDDATAVSVDLLSDELPSQAAKPNNVFSP